MSDPQLVDDKSVVPVHDLQKKKRLPIRGPKIRDAVPKAEDQHQRRGHEDEKGRHEAPLALPDGLPVAQAEGDGAFLHVFGIEKQAVHRAAEDGQPDKDGKQQAVQSQLQNQHFEPYPSFLPLSPQRKICLSLSANSDGWLMMSPWPKPGKARTVSLG